MFADAFPLLIVCRLIAGLGLGGATPCFITLAAEYAPERHRATLVSLLWAAYPLGNAVGGFQTSYLIKNFHWSMVFFAGGVPTLVVAVMLWAFMPESLRFHVSLGRSGDAARGARALDPSLPENIEILAKERPAAKKFPIRELFTEGRAAGTILLGLMLYFGFWTTTVIVLQTPTLFREAGIPLSTSAWLVGTYSLVATVGMAIGQNSDVTAEAAGVVIMDNSLKKVDEFMHISRRMRIIALQSAVGGMALSVIGMIFAATGHLSPVTGAITQEVIDVLAVLNALRAAFPPRIISDL